MKAVSYSSFTKPNFLLIHYELASLRFHKPQLISSPSRAITSSSIGKSSKLNAIRMGRKQESPSSFYTHPSLQEMRNERIENRTRVYDFLRKIGIIPDELDGLELPVTVEVMKERIDFLHKLGLKVEDINNYPLVLGCSVKKNMIPVLDYLGKLGVRKSNLTEFLRRYPQVLHASVVVDLAPVVKYLQGMDIKPNDIPRVLEKYPEVLGFKLEGTMSTSVAYLVGIGVTRREIGRALTKYPEILGMRVGRVIKPFVEYLETLGIPRLAVARLIETHPHILGFGLEEKVKPNVKSLLDFNVRPKMVSSVIAQYPEILGMELDKKLTIQRGFLNSIIGSGPDNFGRIVEKMPQIVNLNNSSVVKHIDFFKKCGFSSEQTRKMVVGCPQLLALSLDIMKNTFDYFEKEMGRDLDDLVEFPAFFTYGLESTVKPRHRLVAEKGLKCSLAWLLNCSDEKFEERMNYDSFEIEEIEMEEFDMNSLMGPKEEEEESGSDFDDESDDEYRL